MTTTPPAWTNAAWASGVDEPFRSDGEFWSGLAASADALVSLVIATAIGVILTLLGERLWAIVMFSVPAVLIVRAGFLSAAASRRSRRAFADRASWRAAERSAVAAVFLRVLVRRRTAR